MTQPVHLSRRILLAAAGAAIAAPHYARAQTVELAVQYAQPHVFKESKDAIAAEFARREPNIRITWVTTPDYDAGSQLILRQATVNQLPDVAYQGLSRQRILAERGIAVDLKPFIDRDGGPAALGYSPPILSQGAWAGIQAGLPYAMSNLIAYANVDLLRRAGVNPDQLPVDWEGHFGLAAQLRGIGDGVEPWYMDTYNTEWTWSSLLFSYGGAFLTPDEQNIAFTSPAGVNAMRLFDRVVKAGMPNQTVAAAQQSFGAGKLALHYRSTAFLRNMIQSVGRNFEMRTYEFPAVEGGGKKLATGGSAGMLLARDPAKQEAGWKFLKFSTSAEGTTLMVKNTGYVPCNQSAIDDPRFLADFYRDNPLFLPATRQVSVAVPWYTFPGGQGVRISQAFGNGLSRIMEQRATPEQVIADLGAEVQRLLPRAG